MHTCIHLCICIYIYIYITYHIVIYSTCTPSFVHAWLHDMSEEPTAWAMEWKRRAFMQVFPRTYPKSSKGTINFGTSASCWHNIDGYPNKRQIIRMPYAHMWYIKMHKRKHLESSPTLTVTLDAKKKLQCHLVDTHSYEVQLIKTLALPLFSGDLDRNIHIDFIDTRKVCSKFWAALKLRTVQVLVLVSKHNCQYSQWLPLANAPSAQTSSRYRL